MKENKYYSYNQGLLSEGCQFCVRGEKLVVFVTGLCPRKCYFCPVSDEKYGKDVVLANERKVDLKDASKETVSDEDRYSDLITEAEAMDAKGAGITGGDPLMKLDRTCEFIKQLKEKFGKEFHIHLYTSLNLLTVGALKKLYDTGLDEVRFHLDLDDDKFWERLELASRYDWDIGVELPLIPGRKKDYKKIIDFIEGKAKFLNLNELERADNEMSKLSEMGFETKDTYSYAIEDSMKVGLELIQYVKQKEYVLDVHLCTAKLKDSIQLANRIKREGEHTHNKFDVVDEEGLLIRGALYLPELAPGFAYRDKLKIVDKEKLILELQPLLARVKKKFKLDNNEIMLDREKCRILLSRKWTKKKKAYYIRLGLKPAIVKEYPTADQLEIEVEFLD